MKEYSYKVGELRTILEKSLNEFKPVLGPNVREENKSNNDKSYKESKDRAEKYDGGLKEPKKGKLYPKIDNNKTTIDVNPDSKPSKRWQKDQIARLKGYTSDMEASNGNERGGVEMDEEGRIADYFIDKSEEFAGKKEMKSKSGLAARTYPDGHFEKNVLLKESEKPSPKRLRFKHTEFLCEKQVLDRVPEEYRQDGQVIRMIDKCDNEYIVECKKIEKTGNVEVNIVGHENKKAMNEQVNRMFELMDYKTPKNGTYNEKLNESKGFGDVFSLVRKAEEV